MISDSGKNISHYLFLYAAVCFTGKILMPFVWIEMALLLADPLGVHWNTAPSTLCRQSDNM